MTFSKTKFITFQGKGKWVKPYVPSQFDKWSLDLYMPKEEVERFKELKVMNHLKRDDDGDYVTFSRPTSKTFKGKLEGLSPPLVTDKDGMPMINVPIGNGSDLTVTLELYPYQPPGKDQPKKNAIRLFAIRVDELVPFANDSFSTSEQAAAAELAKTPPVHTGWQ